MRLWRQLRELSIYPKLVVSFLLVVLPILFISLAMNESGAKSVNKQITNSTSATVRMYMNLLEIDFVRSIQFQLEFINDDDLLNLSTKANMMSESDKRGAVLRLHKRLQLLKNSSSYIKEARLHIPGMKRSIFSTSESIQDTPRAEYEALKVTLDPYESPFYYWNNAIYIPLTYPDAITLPEGQEPLFTLVLEVSKEKLREVLSQFNTVEGGMTFLIGKDAGWIISEGDLYRIQKMREYLTSEGIVQNRNRSIQIDGETFSVTSDTSASLGLTLLQNVPEETLYGPLKMYRSFFWLLSGLSIALVSLFSYWIYMLIHHPLKQLVIAFRKVEHGNLDVAVHHRTKDEFGYLFHQFNAMVGELKVLIHEVYEKNFRLRLSELRQLQSQINPHFLYNSFYIVYRMAKIQDYDKIMEFTKYLGEYFRFITRSDSDGITLQDEWKHVKNYIEIQTIRFSDRIEVDFGEMPKDAGKITIPRLILQPIVENAYKYALEEKECDGRLSVTAIQTMEQVTIIVEDNGDNLRDVKLEELQMKLKDQALLPEMTGMINVHRRLQLNSGEQAGVTVKRSNLGGMLVEIRIPFAKEENDV